MGAAGSSIVALTFVADYEWAQVTRLRSTCVHADVTEGRSKGYRNDSGLPGYTFFPEAANASSLWPYGCWYWMDVPSGIFVNVGKSMASERAPACVGTCIGNALL